MKPNVSEICSYFMYKNISIIYLGVRSTRTTNITAKQSKNFFCLDSDIILIIYLWGQCNNGHKHYNNKV